jgi:hypothetical protein
VAIPIAFSCSRILLIQRSAAIPAVGFCMPIADPLVTKQTAKAAWEMDIRYLDCVERTANEEAAGDVMQAAWRAARSLRGSVSHQPAAR